MSKYKYGVSYNCEGMNFEIDGGGEGDTSVDYLGNDLDKIEQYLLKDANEQEPEKWLALREHPYVGKKADVGGKVVSVICYLWDDLEDYSLENQSGAYYTLCVIYENNESGPIIIE